MGKLKITKPAELVKERHSFRFSLRKFVRKLLKKLEHEIPNSSTEERICCAILTMIKIDLEYRPYLDRSFKVSYAQHSVLLFELACHCNLDPVKNPRRESGWSYKAGGELAVAFYS